MTPRYAHKLRKNARDYWSGKISYEEHGRRNRALWDEIEARPARVKGSVLAALRRALPAA